MLRFTSILMGEVVDEGGTANDFISRSGDNCGGHTTANARIRDRLKARFNEEVLTHYTVTASAATSRPRATTRKCRCR
jgi:hypothetical protein